MIANQDCPGCLCGELSNTLAEHTGKERRHQIAGGRQEAVEAGNNRSRISVCHHIARKVSDCPTM